MQEARPILIIGESGLLGEALRSELKRRCRRYLVPTLSELDLTREAIRLAGYEGRVTLTERPESPGGPERPAYSVLELTLFTRLTGEPTRTWQDALAEFVALRPAEGRQ